MNGAVFMWKCGAHNLVLPRRISCPECAKRDRARLQAKNKCLIDDFDYTQPPPKKPPENGLKKFFEEPLREMLRNNTMLIPRTVYERDDLIFYAKKDAEFTCKLLKTRQDDESAKSRQRRRELLRPTVKEVEPVPDYFTQSHPVVRANQQRSVEALLNYIEHSSPALYTRRCKIEDQLGSSKYARRGEENPTHDIFELFENLVTFAVHLYRKDFRNTEAVKFGRAVCLTVSMQLTNNYKAGLRVEND